MPIKPYTQNDLRMTDIVNEFGGSGSHSLSEYYAGNGLVPPYTLGYPRPNGTATYIPGGGQISFNNFYGASKKVVITEFSQNGQRTARSLGPGTWYIYGYMVGAGGGGGGGDSGQFGGNGGGGGSVQAKWTISSNQTTVLSLWPGRGGGFGASQINGFYVDSQNPNKGRSSYLSTPAEGANWYVTVEPTGSRGWNKSWNSGQPSVECIYMPSEGWYTFYLHIDDNFYLYDAVGNLLASRGFGDHTFSIYFARGWNIVQMLGENTGGPREFEMYIRRSSDNLLVWWSWPATGGGRYSGSMDYLNGGKGGMPGRSSRLSHTSGQGGGGGGGSMLMWHSDNDINGIGTVLGIAPGGGGGSGCGRFAPPLTSSIYNANLNNRGITTDFNTILNLPPDDSALTNGFAAGFSQFGIRLLSGQGYDSWAYFFNPGAGYWDGGAGGGGGGPWGRGGGYRWYYSSGDKFTAEGYYPFNEDSGVGGSQGYFYYNPSYTNVFNYDSTPVYYTSYLGQPRGYGGQGGYGSPTSGYDGGIWLRISNIDDNIWP